MNLIIATNDKDLNLALNFWLNHQPHLRIIGTSGDTAGLLALTKATRPQLILLDDRLANDDLLGFVANLKAAHPAVSVVVLSNEAEIGNYGPAHNVADVISKNQPPERLLALLQTTTSGPADHVTFKKNPS